MGRKSKFINHVATTLGLMLLSIVAHAEETKCIKTNSKNKVHDEVPQDYVGYCGLFALRTAMHQFRCDVDPTNCKMPAILEMINEVQNKLSDRDQGYVELLKRAGEVGIRDESCMPYEKFFPREKNEAVTWDWAQRSSFYTYRALHIPVKPTAEVTRDNWGLIFTALNISRSEQLKSKVEERFASELNRYVQNKNCESRRYPRAALKSDVMDYKKIRHHIDRGNTVLMGLQIPQPGSQSVGGHSVALRNYRQTCCLGLCSTEYEVLDSLGLYWAKSPSGRWVSESEIQNVQGIMSYFHFIEKQAATGPQPTRVKTPITK